MPRGDKRTNTQDHQRKTGHGNEPEREASLQKGGQIGVDASVRRSKADRSVSPKKAAETRKPIEDRSSR